MARKQAEKPKKRGGAREGSGPKMAGDEPRTSVLSIPLTATERELLRARGTAWCRDVLLAAVRG